MSQFLQKYAIFFFVFILLSMVYSLSPIKSLNNTLNIILLAFGLFLGLNNDKDIFSKEIFYAFSILWSYLLINLSYQLSLGWLDFRYDDLLYLLAKASFTFILIISIITHTNFYYKDFYFYIGILIIILIMLGYFFSQSMDGGRYSLGFANSNEAGAVAAIGFGIFLLHPAFKTTLKWLGIIILLIAVILTGSRSALIIAFISGIFYFKFNFVFITTGVLLFSAFFFIIPQLGFEAVGINRLFESINFEEGRIDTNREGEFEVGLLMFKNKFWVGYGLTGYKIIDESLLNSTLDDALGTHNGYLAAAKMYGVFFLTVFIYVIVIKPLNIIRKLFQIKCNYLKVHLFIVFAVLIGAVTEDYIVGVNSLPTSFFFLSLAIIEIYKKDYLPVNN